MKTYKAYRFVDKDPAIDKFRTIVQDHFGTRNFGRKHLSEIEAAGGPAASTMVGWFFGKTRRPQNPTMEAAGRALGFERVWRKMR